LAGRHEKHAFRKNYADAKEMGKAILIAAALMLVAGGDSIAGETAAPTKCGGLLF
jgi:hypothetical protein